MYYITVLTNHTLPTTSTLGTTTEQGIVFVLPIFIYFYFWFFAYSSYNYLLLPIEYYFIACSTDEACKNGGTCTDGICHCNYGYHGTQCQASNKYRYKYIE